MKIKQKRKDIINLLNQTLHHLELLNDDNFDYNNYVSEWENGCGTVCCVAGWYPKWYPDSGFYWESEGGDDYDDTIVLSHYETEDVFRALSKFHKLHVDIIEVLFYGGLFAEAPLTDNPSKKEVINRWKTVINKIDQGVLDEYLK